ncbi:M13 family metallopeptidase [Luteococcus peritonei]|uniref:M13 family metallopeptidase n=1 Tax=Luteococcus peritonei TaxID=88874 RepID=A0ABW4RV60_9ACTN
MTTTQNTLPRPQDDFFRHVNGTYLASTRIDADKSSAGSFVDLADGAQRAVRELIDELAANRKPQAEVRDERDKVAALYADYLDEAAVESASASALSEQLARVEAITDLDALARHWGWSLRHGTASVVNLFVDSDMGDPRVYAPFWVQSGLGLPDRDYYLAEEHAEIRSAYLAHVERMLALAGVEQAASQAQQVLLLETEIAQCHWDRVRNREMTQRYNPMSFTELAELAPGLRLRQVAEGAGIDGQALGEQHIVCQPSFFSEVAELVTEERIGQWLAWARWAMVNSLAPWLGAEMVDADFDFYSRTLNGIEQNKPRWKRGVALVESYLGDALGKLYVERHFPASSKARMDVMVQHLLQAYGESIRNLDWMGEQTREEALHKLATFRPKIGYPDSWRDYSALEVVPGDLVGNVLRAGEHEFCHQTGKLPGPVDPDEWLMLPQTVNAYYHPLRNEIVFPAAILQPPFFDAEADDALNYGGIGSVIGHEIGHGFDDQGSTCDGEGRLRNWWTDEDRAAFSERTGALVDQYDALVPQQFADQPEAPHVNGRLTIGENIGDLGGLGIALKAYRIACGGEADDEQLRRLFTGYATIWCSKIRDEALRVRLATDPHSPAEFRCNQIASNVDDFHRVFDVQPGDGMWLEPERRVSIW